jgi:hypothetical protein
MKAIKHCFKDGEEKKGEWEYNREGECVQCIIVHKNGIIIMKSYLIV